MAKTISFTDERVYPGLSSHSPCKPASGPTPLALTDANIRAAWTDEVLSRHDWDVFLTGTYARPVRTSEKIVRDTYNFLWLWQLETAEQRGKCFTTFEEKRDGYGRLICTHERYHGPWFNSYRKGRAQPVWVLGIEPHRSGALHIHMLIRWSDKLPNLDHALGMKLWNAPRSEGGLGYGLRCHIETPRSQGDVAGYLSKCAVGDGDIQWSQSFDVA